MVFPYKLIDLTHTLDSNIPTWDDNCGFHHHLQIDYQDCESDIQFRVMTMQMQAGIGTHMDAPSHCIPGGTPIHEFDINDLCMPCVIIDVSSKVHERYSLTLEDILDFEAKYGVIDKKTCVMVKTGWEKFWPEPKKYHNNHIFPSVSIQAAELLLERDASALGIDTLSPDRPEEGFKVHQLFLKNNKILIENVANLDKMLVVGAYVMALPIKVKEVTEAPIRLVGMVKF